MFLLLTFLDFNMAFFVRGNSWGDFSSSHVYSQVSNKRGGWKKFQFIINKGGQNEQEHQYLRNGVK